ncbi:hypothetical protein HOD75_00485 [archaeon]|jgi:hypothetical protein|nr:hypothetical protein [archaeon]MBT4241352.1 hypothetical protein [archaeon]MBT4418173.1 hypothetical protein [archaeon]
MEERTRKIYESMREPEEIPVVALSADDEYDWEDDLSMAPSQRVIYPDNAKLRQLIKSYKKSQEVLKSEDYSKKEEIYQLKDCLDTFISMDLNHELDRAKNSFRRRECYQRANMIDTMKERISTQIVSKEWGLI